jgi:hypothetical protein
LKTRWPGWLWLRPTQFQIWLRYIRLFTIKLTKLHPGLIKRQYKSFRHAEHRYSHFKLKFKNLQIICRQSGWSIHNHRYGCNKGNEKCVKTPSTRWSCSVRRYSRFIVQEAAWYHSAWLVRTQAYCGSWILRIGLQ